MRRACEISLCQVDRPRVETILVVSKLVHHTSPTAEGDQQSAMFITILEVSKLVLHTGWMNALCTILEVSKLVLHTGEVLCSHMKHPAPYWR